jgi:hypothetical protein
VCNQRINLKFQTCTPMKKNVGVEYYSKNQKNTNRAHQGEIDK